MAKAPGAMGKGEEDRMVADHLFMASRTLQELRVKGIVPPHGTPLDKCREAYIMHMRDASAGRLRDPSKNNYDAERARLTAEQADRVAAQNATARGEFLPKTALTQTIRGIIEVAKLKLKRVPGRAAPGNLAMQEAIRAGIEDALLDVSEERMTLIDTSEVEDPEAFDE